MGSQHSGCSQRHGSERGSSSDGTRRSTSRYVHHELSSPTTTRAKTTRRGVAPNVSSASLPLSPGRHTATPAANTPNHSVSPTYHFSETASRATATIAANAAITTTTASVVQQRQVAASSPKHQAWRDNDVEENNDECSLNVDRSTHSMSRAPSSMRMRNATIMTADEAPSGLASEAGTLSIPMDSNTAVQQTFSPLPTTPAASAAAEAKVTTGPRTTSVAIATVSTSQNLEGDSGGPNTGSSSSSKWVNTSVGQSQPSPLLRCPQNEAPSQPAPEESPMPPIIRSSRQTSISAARVAASGDNNSNETEKRRPHSLSPEARPPTPIIKGDDCGNVFSSKSSNKRGKSKKERECVAVDSIDNATAATPPPPHAKDVMIGLLNPRSGKFLFRKSSSSPSPSAAAAVQGGEAKRSHGVKSPSPVDPGGFATADSLRNTGNKATRALTVKGANSNLSDKGEPSSPAALATVIAGQGKCRARDRTNTTSKSGIIDHRGLPDTTAVESGAGSEREEGNNKSVTPASDAPNLLANERISASTTTTTTTVTTQIASLPVDVALPVDDMQSTDNRCRGSGGCPVVSLLLPAAENAAMRSVGNSPLLAESANHRSNSLVLHRRQTESAEAKTTALLQSLEDTKDGGGSKGNGGGARTDQSPYEHAIDNLDAWSFFMSEHAHGEAADSQQVSDNSAPDVDFEKSEVGEQKTTSLIDDVKSNQNQGNSQSDDMCKYSTKSGHGKSDNRSRNHNDGSEDSHSTTSTDTNSGPIYPPPPTASFAERMWGAKAAAANVIHTHLQQRSSDSMKNKTCGEGKGAAASSVALLVAAAAPSTPDLCTGPNSSPMYSPREFPSRIGGGGVGTLSGATTVTDTTARVSPRSPYTSSPPAITGVMISKNNNINIGCGNTGKIGNDDRAPALAAPPNTDCKARERKSVSQSAIIAAWNRMGARSGALMAQPAAAVSVGKVCVANGRSNCRSDNSPEEFSTVAASSKSPGEASVVFCSSKSQCSAAPLTPAAAAFFSMQQKEQEKITTEAKQLREENSESAPTQASEAAHVPNVNVGRNSPVLPVRRQSVLTHQRGPYTVFIPPPPPSPSITAQTTKEEKDAGHTSPRQLSDVAVFEALASTAPTLITGDNPDVRSVLPNVSSGPLTVVLSSRKNDVPRSRSEATKGVEVVLGSDPNVSGSSDAAVPHLTTYALPVFFTHNDAFDNDKSEFDVVATASPKASFTQSTEKSDGIVNADSTAIYHKESRVELEGLLFGRAFAIPSAHVENETATAVNTVMHSRMSSDLSDFVEDSESSTSATIYIQHTMDDDTDEVDNEPSCPLVTKTGHPLIEMFYEHGEFKNQDLQHQNDDYGGPEKEIALPLVSQEVVPLQLLPELSSRQPAAAGSCTTTHMARAASGTIGILESHLLEARGSLSDFAPLRDEPTTPQKPQSCKQQQQHQPMRRISARLGLVGGNPSSPGSVLRAESPSRPNCRYAAQNILGLKDGESHNTREKGDSGGMTSSDTAAVAAVVTASSTSLPSQHQRQKQQQMAVAAVPNTVSGPESNADITLYCNNNNTSLLHQCLPSPPALAGELQSSSIGPGGSTVAGGAVLTRSATQSTFPQTRPHDSQLTRSSNSSAWLMPYWQERLTPVATQPISSRSSSVPHDDTATYANTNHQYQHPTSNNNISSSGLNLNAVLTAGGEECRNNASPGESRRRLLSTASQGPPLLAVRPSSPQQLQHELSGSGVQWREVSLLTSVVGTPSVGAIKLGSREENDEVEEVQCDRALQEPDYTRDLEDGDRHDDEYAAYNDEDIEKACGAMVGHRYQHKQQLWRWRSDSERRVHLSPPHFMNESADQRRWQLRRTPPEHGNGDQDEAYASRCSEQAPRMWGSQSPRFGEQERHQLQRPNRQMSRSESANDKDEVDNEEYEEEDVTYSGNARAYDTHDENTVTAAAAMDHRHHREQQSPSSHLRLDCEGVCCSNNDASSERDRGNRGSCGSYRNVVFRDQPHFFHQSCPLDYSLPCTPPEERSRRVDEDCNFEYDNVQQRLHGTSQNAHNATAAFLPFSASDQEVFHTRTYTTCFVDPTYRLPLTRYEPPMPSNRNTYTAFVPLADISSSHLLASGKAMFQAGYQEGNSKEDSSKPTSGAATNGSGEVTTTATTATITTMTTAATGHGFSTGGTPETADTLLVTSYSLPGMHRLIRGQSGRNVCNVAGAGAVTGINGNPLNSPLFSSVSSAPTNRISTGCSPVQSSLSLIAEFTTNAAAGRVYSGVESGSQQQQQHSPRGLKSAPAGVAEVMTPVGFTEAISPIKHDLQQISGPTLTPAIAANNTNPIHNKTVRAARMDSAPLATPVTTATTSPKSMLTSTGSAYTQFGADRSRKSSGVQSGTGAAELNIGSTSFGGLGAVFIERQGNTVTHPRSSPGTGSSSDSGIRCHASARAFQSSPHLRTGSTRAIVRTNSEPIMTYQSHRSGTLYQNQSQELPWWNRSWVAQSESSGLPAEQCASLPLERGEGRTHHRDSSDCSRVVVAASSSRSASNAPPGLQRACTQEDCEEQHGAHHDEERENTFAVSGEAAAPQYAVKPNRVPETNLLLSGKKPVEDGSDIHLPHFNSSASSREKYRFYGEGSDEEHCGHDDEGRKDENYDNPLHFKLVQSLDFDNEEGERHAPTAQMLTVGFDDTDDKTDQPVDTLVKTATWRLCSPFSSSSLPQNTKPASTNADGAADAADGSGASRDFSPKAAATFKSSSAAAFTVVVPPTSSFLAETRRNANDNEKRHQTEEGREGKEKEKGVDTANLRSRSDSRSSAAAAFEATLETLIESEAYTRTCIAESAADVVDTWKAVWVALQQTVSVTSPIPLSGTLAPLQSNVAEGTTIAGEEGNNEVDIDGDERRGLAMNAQLATSPSSPTPSDLPTCIASVPHSPASLLPPLSVPLLRNVVGAATSKETPTYGTTNVTTNAAVATVVSAFTRQDSADDTMMTTSITVRATSSGDGEGGSETNGPIIARVAAAAAVSFSTAALLGDEDLVLVSEAEAHEGVDAPRCLISPLDGGAPTTIAVADAEMSSSVRPEGGRENTRAAVTSQDAPHNDGTTTRSALSRLGVPQYAVDASVTETIGDQPAASPNDRSLGEETRPQWRVAAVKLTLPPPTPPMSPTSTQTGLAATIMKPTTETPFDTRQNSPEPFWPSPQALERSFSTVSYNNDGINRDNTAAAPAFFPPSMAEKRQEQNSGEEGNAHHSRTCQGQAVTRARSGSSTYAAAATDVLLKQFPSPPFSPLSQQQQQRASLSLPTSSWFRSPQLTRSRSAQRRSSVSQAVCRWCGEAYTSAIICPVARRIHRLLREERKKEKLTKRQAQLLLCEGRVAEAVALLKETGLYVP